MKPTRKKNLENRGNVPAPQVVPSHGKAALPPATRWRGTAAASNRPDRQMQVNKREAYHLGGGVNVGERSREEDFGLFFKSSNCTFSLGLSLPTGLHV